MMIHMHSLGKLSLGILFVILCMSACKEDTQQKTTRSSGDSALDKLNALVSGSPDDATVLYDRASYQYEQRDYDGTIRDLEAALAIDSLVPDYYHLLSDAYMDYFRSKDALNVMMDAEKQFPERIPTLLKLSETQLILKQNEESLLTVAKILTYDPSNPEGHFMKGMNFRAMGETDRAIGAFQTVTELDPDLIDAWLIIGDLFMEKGQPIARQFYETATNIRPDDPNVWHALAYFLQNNDDDSAALDIYRKINVIDKNYLDAYLNAGIIYLSNGDLDEAMEQFDILAKVKPQSPHPYYYRALIYEKKGQREAALVEIQNCLNLDAEYPEARKTMGRLER